MALVIFGALMVAGVVPVTGISVGLTIVFIGLFQLSVQSAFKQLSLILAKRR